MADCKVLEPGDANVLYKASSGGIRFKMRAEGQGPELLLTASQDPCKPLYKIIIGQETKLKNYNEKKEVKFVSRNLLNLEELREFCLTWHSNKITLTVLGDNEPILVYDRIYTEPSIGFVQFKPVCRHSTPVEWVIETSPVTFQTLPSKRFEETLSWLPMADGKLPPDAMIGGFENELTYIARAHHNNSLCPGKYKPSTGLAYVPWGHSEHTKQHFEILCGFNGQWVKTQSNNIPLNAFIGGYSEVQHEPLYIGRAMIEGKLISGKVHIRYHLCYLPYNGKEVEVSAYEILVLPDRQLRQALTNYNTSNVFNL